jgi:hypothetical protein
MRAAFSLLAMVWASKDKNVCLYHCSRETLVTNSLGNELGG